MQTLVYKRGWKQQKLKLMQTINFIHPRDTVSLRTARTFEQRRDAKK